MEYPPRKLIEMVRAGFRDEVLSSNSMWFCSSCYLCTVRCPRDIKPTDIMHALEILSLQRKKATKETSTPVMYQSFVDSIWKNGRVHEFGFMMNYYFKTNPLKALGMTGVALGLLTHGRMPILATKIKGTDELKAIMEKARALGGAR